MLKARNLSLSLPVPLTPLTHSCLIHITMQFQAVREATQRMLEARYQLDIHHAALVDLQRKYQATGATTNFNALLSESAAQLETEHPYESAADPLLLRFDEDAGIVADYEDEQIDDDIAIAGESTHQLGRNATCPITMRALLDIEDPVEDSKNFVYEKHAILEMLGRSASIKCPVAGTNHMLSKSDLRPARAVINAKKRGVNAANKNKNGGGGKKDMVLELD